MGMGDYYKDDEYYSPDKTFEELEEEIEVLKADKENLKMQLQGHVSDKVTLDGKLISVKGQLDKRTMWDNIWVGSWGFLTAIATEVIIYILR